MNCYKCATPLPDHSKFCMACGADVSGEGHSHATLSTEADPELFAALQAELGTDYTVERELGRGGMAIVYLGKDNHLGRKVAIKLLPPMLTFGSGPGFIERFKREARTSATLDHPHIIPIYRVSTGGKLFWYVMKFLQGESLDEMLKRDGAFDVDRTVDIISQAADALDYAHQNDVVHRDVKPANLMIDKKGWVTVTDFGIAKALNTGTLTGSGSAIGTPHYMAPEQCIGVGVTGASDQYALGISAYQMLCGELPFKADSILEVMRMHSADRPPPLGERREGLPAGLVDAVERALAKDQADRFPSCGAFARELVRWTRDVEIAPRRPNAAADAKQTVEETPRLKPVVKQRPETPVAPAPPPSAPTSRPRLVVGAAAIAVVFIAAFAISKFLPSRDPAQPTVGGQRTPARLETDSLTKVLASNPPSATGGSTTIVDDSANRGRRPGPVGVDQAATLPPARGADAKQTSVPDRPPRTATERQKTPPVTKAPESGNKAPAPVSREPAPAVSAAPALITVGSRPTSAITINGKPVASNPVSNFEVPAGRVVIRFQVTDSTGVWTVDTVFTLAPGERRNLRFIQLRRP